MHSPDEKLLSKALLCLNNSVALDWKLFLIENSEDPGKKLLLHRILENCEINESRLEVVSMKNLGFGAGHNFVLDKLDSEYHLVLNPDIEFEEDLLNRIIEFMERNQDFGLLSPAVFGPNSERHFLCKTNPSLFLMFLRSFAPSVIKKKFSRLMRRHEMLDRNYELPMINVPYLTGCFMLFRTTVFKKLNGFDDNFFLYYEDADISRRTLRYAKSIYNPQFKVIHHWQRGAHKSKKLRFHAVASGIRYSLKWLFKRS